MDARDSRRRSTLKAWLHVERRLTRRRSERVWHWRGLTLELFLQFGYGMMEHCRFLIGQWDGGVVVLSPRDLSAGQLQRLADQVHGLNGTVLLDPQIYRPTFSHGRLIKHTFWPTTGFAFGGAELSRCLTELITLNEQLNTGSIVLPGLYAERIDDDWLQNQLLILEEAQRQDVAPEMMFHTVAISSDALRNDVQVEVLLDAIRGWDVDGIYLVCQHPNSDYYVSDPGWLANCLDLIAGIRLDHKSCVVGYANHQMLIASAAGASAICSGTWMNVRSFGVEKFDTNNDEEVKQRATWYYAPHLLAEFKVQYLDLAKKVGELATLKSSPALLSPYADELFSAPQPTLAAFTEQQAFRHYLQSLRAQAQAAVQDTFDATVDSQLQQLDTARNELLRLRRLGIVGQQRDMSDAIDASRGALESLRVTRGAVLRRMWRNVAFDVV